MRIGQFFRNGSVVAKDIELDLRTDHRRSDGRVSWHGEAWLPTDEIIIPGDQLRLEISEGETEDVVIDRVTVDSTAGRMLVRFHPVE